MMNQYKNHRLIVLLAAILAMLSVSSCHIGDNASDTTAVETGAVDTTPATEVPSPTAPDFTVIDGDGSPTSLSDLVGKPVVLNFWASWCPPCKAEMPDFEKMYKQYGDRVHFMIVNLTDGNRETVETAKLYIETQGYTFPVYFDTTMEAANTYQVASIPTTYFVNADGTIRSYASGMLDAETLEQQLKLLLGE